MELITFSKYKKKLDVKKAKKGDKEAFLALINENRLNIYRIAKGMLKEEKDVEDAIQNTVIKAFENIKSLKKEEFFKTWIIRILINECNSILRKGKKYTSFDENLVDTEYYDTYKDMELTSAIASLNEELRVTTLLYYFEDISTVEIAKILDVAEGTVRSRLARAREKLKEVIGEENEDE